MHPDDVEYYEMRAQQDREKAKACNNQAVARAHINMDQEY